MAVDTAQKRYSMLGIDLPVRLILHPPAGSVDAARRQTFVMKYSGILFGGTGSFQSAWASMSNVIIQAMVR